MPVGLFGKYPGKRDFLSLNLPKTVITTMEDWLQAAIVVSSQQLGPAWRDHYLVHPIWNFRIGAKVIGTDCVGAMMPSVDGIGRYFPLSIIAWAGDGAQLAPFRDVAAEWVDDVHHRLLSALDDAPTADPSTLLEGLTDLERPRGTQRLETIAGGWRIVSAEPTEQSAIAHLEELRFAEEEESLTLWWTKGSHLVPGQLVCFVGMPAPCFYVSMLGSSEATLDDPPVP
ncbi:type VI secretion system-associated protein TagF [Rhizobium sp. CSW-27]|uniref:type VI secretion system-associated protein TagF n=1 Tax=Rhizobium sp. CSW-27 TaxID=2839985 RepID=UPI001C02EA2D|nr:type VI secretion system-associated protein TagF [Rhizobium sp. CSW-27]MBT9373085.1 type VI secretion system-associated protein TagF [Rhizobium sp. CSW-27]